MFVEVSIVLAGMEFAVLLFDKEERGCFRRVGRMNLSRSQVFFKEVLSSFLFIWGEWVDFAYLGHEVFIKVNLVII